MIYDFYGTRHLFSDVLATFPKMHSASRCSNPSAVPGLHSYDGERPHRAMLPSIQASGGQVVANATYLEAKYAPG